MRAAADAPPGFADAGNLRQQARAAGMDPNYWYPVEEVRRIKPETVIEVVFWKRSIALFRGKDGTFQAVEDRCAHRQLQALHRRRAGLSARLCLPWLEYGGEGRSPRSSARPARAELSEACAQNLPGEGPLWPGLALPGRSGAGGGPPDPGHSRTREARPLDLPAALLHVVGSPLDGDRQCVRLHPRASASSLPAL